MSGYPDCKLCNGAGFLRVIASDTYEPGDHIVCGNCKERAEIDGIVSRTTEAFAGDVKRIMNDVKKGTPQRLLSNSWKRCWRRATARIARDQDSADWNESRAIARFEIVDRLPTLIAQIRTMETENKAMREALDYIVRLTESEPDEHPVSMVTRLLPIRQEARDTLRDIDRARAALKEQ